MSSAPRPLPVRDGFLICPKCLINKKLQRINPDTVARNLECFCTNCKRKTLIDIVDGRVYLSAEINY